MKLNEKDIKEYYTQKANFDFIKYLFKDNGKNSLNKPIPHRDSRSQRNVNYPNRFKVPDSLVDWSQSFPEYDNNIQNYQFIANDVKDNQLLSLDSLNRWSDNDNPLSIDWSQRITIFNGFEQKVNDVINFDSNGYPKNPAGRTGLIKNGLLGKIGPNQAADPLVIKKVGDDFYFIAIERRDKTGWALPGGMIDKINNSISTTLKNELNQEALNCQNSDIVKKNLDNILNSNGKTIYKGYVDDCRNTDTSWLETTVVMFDVTNYPEICNMKLSAGDDAINVTWLKVDESDSRFNNFYADHKNYVYMGIKSLNEINKPNDEIYFHNESLSISNTLLYASLGFILTGFIFYKIFKT